MGVGIAYMDGPRLARSLFAASDWVAAGREEIGGRPNITVTEEPMSAGFYEAVVRALAEDR